VHLDIAVPAEACPLNLAPTASTTAALAVGDALAVTLLKARGFTEEILPAPIRPAPWAGDCCCSSRTSCARRGCAEGSRRGDTGGRPDGNDRKGLGLTAIVDAAGRVEGVFTDGDLRRALDRSADLRATRMDSVMMRNAKTVRPDSLAAAAVHLMETHRITALIVVEEDNTLIGALNVHDLLRAGVV